MQILKICTCKNLHTVAMLAAFGLFSNLLAAPLSVAQETNNSQRAAIEIISIEHRDPMYVRAQLVSLLDPRGNIGLVDNKLIIASTAGNLQQLKTLIADTDVPARRLVVSIDFDYGSTLGGNTAQQSSQALEGDRVSFIDSADASAADSVVSGQVLSTQPRLVINSTVRGDKIAAGVEIFNVPGFSGNHPLDLVPGQWYVINPVEEIDSSLEQSTGFELVEEPLAQVAAIAIRVDVLP